MKKFISMVVLVVLFLCPLTVRADLNQIGSTIYAESVGAGSNIIMIIQPQGARDFSGTLTFDSNVLTLTDVVADQRYSLYDDDLYNAINVTKTVNGGSAKLSFTNVTRDMDYSIVVTFKLKQAPSNGSTTVKFTPAGNGWTGATSSTIKIAKEKECPTCPTCPTCSKDEVTCPACETCKECEVCDTTTNETNNAGNETVQTNTENNKNNNNTALFVSLGACAVLTVAVIVLAVKKN